MTSLIFNNTTAHFRVAAGTPFLFLKDTSESRDFAILLATDTSDYGWNWGRRKSAVLLCSRGMSCRHVKERKIWIHARYWIFPLSNTKEGPQRQANINLLRRKDYDPPRHHRVRYICKISKMHRLTFYVLSFIFTYYFFFIYSFTIQK